MSLLAAISPDSQSIYKLSYDQNSGVPTSTSVDGNVINFPTVPLDLAFNDSVMEQVKTAWEAVVQKSEGERGEYMMFEDREGAEAEDPYE